MTGRRPIEIRARLLNEFDQCLVVRVKDEIFWLARSLISYHDATFAADGEIILTLPEWYAHSKGLRRGVQMKIDHDIPIPLPVQLQSEPK